MQTRTPIVPEIELLPPYRHLGGFQWLADIPPGFEGPGDSGEHCRFSRLRLCEDGVPLGPRHAQHTLIESIGAGHYSHWGEALQFSTSDGSDPNSNGRSYTIFHGEPTPTVLALGSCHIFESMHSLHRRGIVDFRWDNPCLTYTPREALQVVEAWTGAPNAVVPLPSFIAIPPPDVAEGADVVFLEFGSSIDIAYGSTVIPRAELLNLVFGSMETLGEAESRIARRWLHQGLIRQNENVRQESVEGLRAVVGAAGADRAIALEILENARGRVQDVEGMTQSIVRIIDLLKAGEVCVTSAHNAFTPDGRPLSWPMNFPRLLDEVCGRLRLPLLDPTRIIGECGAAYSLDSDLHHFTPGFLAVLGDRLLALAQEQRGD